MAVQSLSANKDIDYITKDFSSAADAIINFANVNFGPGTSANRLWTNFNTDSFSRNWLEIVAFISDIFFFYFDTQATQAYLQTATVRSAVKDIAKQFGFVPSTATSASGNVTFTFTAAGTLPRGFRVKSSNGLPYYLTNAVVASAAGNYTGTVLQGEIKVEQFTATGLQNEEFNLSSANVVRDLNNLNLQDISPQVVVNGNSYTLVDSFIRSNGTDTAAVIDTLGEVIGGGGRVFELGERPDGTPFIMFGDGIFGRKIAPGELISITYRTGGGSAGNIGEQSLTTLVDNNPAVASVINPAKFSGGADEQSIEQLRDLIPASLRTLERAVAESDYSDLLKVTFTEVAAASTERNTDDPGIDLNIYVVPQGNGITNITDNTNLRNKLSNFLDRRKMVTVQFQILDAFGVEMLITLKIFITNTASKTTVKNAVNTTLSDFFNLLTGGTSGAGIGFAEKILTEDLSALIKAIPGIDRFEFSRHTYRPRIALNVVGLNTSYKVSPVEIFPNVSESEWLAGAAGSLTRSAGVVLFSNSTAVPFTYNSLSGLVTYTIPTSVDLTFVAPGDQFRGRTSPTTDYTIFGVDNKNKTLYISAGVTVDGTPGLNTGGSIRSAATSYESYKVFKKLNASATNLSIDSITDNSLDLSVITGTGTAISARVLLDNSQIFVKNQYATGLFYLVDAAGNIWEIVSNDSNKLTTSITAVNDASVTTVSSGDYKIVEKLVGRTVVFNGNVFNIQFNSDKTVYSVGAQFANIGTIGDTFQLSQQQTNLGNLGITADLISYDVSSKQILLNNSPDLNGATPNYNLIDSTGQIFNISAIDNRALPSSFYDVTNLDTSKILKGSSLGVQYAQGFKVSSSNIFSVVSFYLKRSGNIVGNLVAKIVNDNGSGLPNLASPIATSQPLLASTLAVISGFNDNTTPPITGFAKALFYFTTPPTLAPATQYHLVISSDASYTAAQADNVATFSNTGPVAFSYNSLSGLIQYASAVDLSNVSPGHYFKDGLGKLFQILSVDNSTDRVTLATALSIDNTLSANSGDIYKKDNVYVAADISSPTYTDGKASQFDGSVWADDAQGPVLNRFAQNTDFIFSVEGPKSITIDSNLTPVMGPLATIAERYYDDKDEISMIIGVSNGLVTSATNVNPNGRGTVNTIPNSKVDNFVFRTSKLVDDVTNLRLNEIPQLSLSNVMLDVFGGVD